MAMFHHRNNRVMRDTLNKIGCPIFYSLWDHNLPARVRKFANSWSIPEGIDDSWDSMISQADRNDVRAKYSGPGGWNNPGMLQVGIGGLTANRGNSL